MLVIKLSQFFFPTGETTLRKRKQYLERESIMNTKGPLFDHTITITTYTTKNSPMFLGCPVEDSQEKHMIHHHLSLLYRKISGS